MTNTTTPPSTGVARAVTSLRNRQGIRDEVAQHILSPEVQALLASKSAKLAQQKQPSTSSEAQPDPMRPMADKLETVLQTLMATGTYPGAPPQHLPDPMLPAMAGAERALTELMAETYKSMQSK